VSPPATRLIRGSVLQFRRDPGAAADPAAWDYRADAVLHVADGRIAGLYDAAALPAGLAQAGPLDDHRGRLILPGFVDTHIHSAQVDVIASYGAQLLDWLERYTFPAERRFVDAGHAAEAAEFFLDRLLGNGITTASVYPTVHRQSVDAFFAAAERRRLRMLAGKVMMDRNAPEGLRDDVASAEADNRALITRWHGRGRLGYSLTPRFAITSTPEQLAMTGRLLAERPDLHLQTHLAENRDEIALIARLFPDSRSYLDVYDRVGLVGRRSIFAHCIHLDDADLARLAEAEGAIAFCPTSNLFIGSGLFRLERARAAGIRVGLGTDVGGGTSYSMLQTLAEAYKVLQLNGENLNPWRGFYLATLGGAEALGLDHAIGSFAPGREADLVVLDLAATPVLARRTAAAATVEERLFALMMLGDDRAVAATYVLGEPAYRRAAG
jgi:guanine deaminase